MTAADLVAETRAGIAALADPAKAGPMQRYMKSSMPYHGVSAEPLSRFCRELFDRERLADEDDWQQAVLALWDEAAFREERYAATTLARHRHYREHQQPHTVDLYRHLVVTGAWWDHVDQVATHLVRGLLERHPAAIAPQLHDWARSYSPHRGRDEFGHDVTGIKQMRPKASQKARLVQVGLSSWADLGRLPGSTTPTAAAGGSCSGSSRWSARSS